LVYLRARYYDPATGRFISKDPFPGLAALPATLHPYQYALNNPVNLVDPSGQFVFAAIIGGILIGGGLAALGFINANPGYTLSDYLNSVCFWRAVGIGAATGIVAGLVGGFIGGLGVFGLGLKGAILGGAISGYYAGLAGEFARQLLTEGRMIDPHAVLTSGLFGLVTGGIFGAIGYGIGKGIRSFFAKQWQAVKNRGFIYDPALPPKVKGETNWLGDIRINPNYPASSRARTLIHEQVHSLLTPRGFGQGVRTWIAGNLYNKSNLLQYAEEAIAESVSQIATGGSLWKGLQFPIRGGYVSSTRVIIEGMASMAGIGGLLYSVYEAIR
jgi:hypothetical protein